MGTALEGEASQETLTWVAPFMSGAGVGAVSLEKGPRTLSMSGRGTLLEEVRPERDGGHVED